jgi:hypothetical protein
VSTTSVIGGATAADTSHVGVAANTCILSTAGGGSSLAAGTYNNIVKAGAGCSAITAPTSVISKAQPAAGVSPTSCSYSASPYVYTATSVPIATITCTNVVSSCAVATGTTALPTGLTLNSDCSITGYADAYIANPAELTTYQIVPTNSRGSMATPVKVSIQVQGEFYSSHFLSFFVSDTLWLRRCSYHCL